MQRERPTVDDVDPAAMAVDATPDEVRNRSDQDETEVAQVADGALAPVDETDEVDESELVSSDESPEETDDR